MFTLIHWVYKICCLVSQEPGPWFNIKMSSYQQRKSHCGDKTILRPSYLHKGISYTGKTTSLYWIRVLMCWWHAHIWSHPVIWSHIHFPPCSALMVSTWKARVVSCGIKRRECLYTIYRIMYGMLWIMDFWSQVRWFEVSRSHYLYVRWQLVL